MKISALKKTSLKPALSAAALTFSMAATWAQTINNPAPYCASKFFSNYNMFNNIKIKGTQLDFGPMGVWTSPNDYGYYNTFTFPTLQRAESVPVVLNVYSVNDVEPAYFALWIDFNHNNSFEAAELVLQNANTTQARLPVMGAPVSPITKQITIPQTAMPGKTRARLTRGSSDNPMGPYDPNYRINPCNEVGASHTMGNTYDFNIEIGNAPTGIEATETKLTPGSVFPNPANGHLTLLLEDVRAKGSVSLSDVTGRTVQQSVLVQGKAELHLKDLPNGMYYLSAHTGSGIFRQKVVVAH